jgi:large subunit ribosomal protein L32e
MPSFSRRTWNRYSKFGRKRKKKVTWRKPKGRDNKMREKRKGYPAVVSIGYRGAKTDKKEVKIIRNLKDLEKAEKGLIFILGKMGKKKKIGIAEKAKEMKIEMRNLDVDKFLKENKKEEKKDESK